MRIQSSVRIQCQNEEQEQSPFIVGMMFNPSDQILIQNYLLKKVYGIPNLQSFVFDFDLYGTVEPWDLWTSFPGIDGQDLYFFTKLKRTTNKSGHLSAHVNRKVGLSGGTWSGENSPTRIYSTQTVHGRQIVGYCKRFRYENLQSPEHHGEWIMLEYSLHESLLVPVPNSSYHDPNYVLCRMRKNDRPKRKAAGQRFSNVDRSVKKRVLAPKTKNSIDDMGEKELMESVDHEQTTIMAPTITDNYQSTIELTAKEKELMESIYHEQTTIMAPTITDNYQSTIELTAKEKELMESIYHEQTTIMAPTITDNYQSTTSLEQTTIMAPTDNYQSTTSPIELAPTDNYQSTTSQIELTAKEIAEEIDLWISKSPTYNYQSTTSQIELTAKEIAEEIDLWISRD